MCYQYSVLYMFAVLIELLEIWNIAKDEFNISIRGCVHVSKLRCISVCLCLITFAFIVTMVMTTQSPSVKAELGSQIKLHCQFFLDHKAPNVTVEWHLQRPGTRTQLFMHNSRSGQSQGTGVRLTSLIEGDASYTLLSSEMGSEGTYVCSVSVMPLSTSLDIKLHVQGGKE